MRKFEATNNEKELSKEEIAERQDFGRVVTSYEKALDAVHKPLYKNPKAFLALLAILLIVYLISTRGDKTDAQDSRQLPQEQVERGIETN